MNSFNLLAPIYDFLSKLVFGVTLQKAQIQFLGELNSSHSILILGGGTGEILEFLPECQSVTFIDKSEKMVRRAKRRNSASLVEFIQKDFMKFKSPKNYEVVICPFFLDCFNKKNLSQVISKVKSVIVPNGQLFVIDFQSQKNSGLLITMHLFFRMFAFLESKKLKNIHLFILQEHFDLKKEALFHKKMIFSRVYKKAHK